MTYDPNRSNRQKRVYTTESKHEAQSFANCFYGSYIKYFNDLFIVIL